MREGKIKSIGLCTLMVMATLAFGTIFTTVRSNAVSAESFEDCPNQVEYNIQSLEELVRN